MKKIIAMLLCLIMMVSLVACGDKPASNTPDNPQPGNSQPAQPGNDKEEFVWPETPEKVYKLSVANAVTDKTPSGQALLAVKAALEERSNGAVTLDIFWESVIGTANEQAEAVLSGSLDMAVISSAVLSQYDDKINVLSLPFIVADREHAKKIVDECFDDITSNLNGVIGIPLGIWELGSRHLVTVEKEVKTLEDMAGLSLRVMDGQIYTKVFNALGAIPQNIAAGELVTALQQGVVDGVEEPFTMMANQQQYTFCKYAAMIGYNYSVAVPVLSNITAATLPDEVLDLIYEVFDEYKHYSIELGQQYEEEYIDLAIENGMTINYLEAAELNRFVEAVRPIWDEYTETIGADLIDRVYNCAG